MKRPVLTAWFAVVLLALLLPATAAAAKPTKFIDERTVIECGSPTDDGFVSFFVDIAGNGESFGDLNFWADPADPFNEAPTAITSAFDVSGDATGVQATFDLVEYDETTDPPFGDPAGTAVLDVTLTPDGDPFPVDERFRNGNRWERASGTVQPLLIEGSLTLPGADLTDFSPCLAVHQRVAVFLTNPAAFNIRFDETSLNCVWESEDEFVSLHGFGDAFGGFGEVFVATPTREIGGGGDAVLTDTAFTLDVPLVDFLDGSDVGFASASASLSPQGDAVRVVEANGRNHIKSVIQVLSVDGQLDVEIEGVTTSYPMDDEHCSAESADVRVHEVRPAGPKPKPYPNEGPAQAIPLALGQSVTLRTGAGAIEPEAPCVSEGGDEVPFGNTAWYSVQGTGGELTADTAGSDYDTVLGIYVQEGTDLVQVACVDDVVIENGEEIQVILQAAVTWDSDAGVTYLIQAGGFAGETGTLVLAID